VFQASLTGGNEGGEMGRYPSRLSHADVAGHPCQPSRQLSKPSALKWRLGLAGQRFGLPRCAHDGLDHDCAGAVIEAGKGVVEADRDPPAMLAASRRTRRSPPLPHDSWPAPITVIAASKPMSAISAGADAGAGDDEPTGEVLAVQPAAAADQDARARFERADTAGAAARSSQPAGAVDGGHEVQPSSPSHH
jgi:hypothetical protein